MSNIKTPIKTPKRTQDDRLLKRLSRSERKHQEQLRKLILDDPLFKVI